MVLATVDMIVRRTLLERGLPIHWYSEILFHVSSGIRELTKDSLQIINTVRLPVNPNGDYGYINLPDDFVDDLGLSIPVGDRLQPVPKNNNLNPLISVNENTGLYQPNDSNSNLNTAQNVFGFLPGFYWFWNVNDWGEPTGRYFGAGGGSNMNGYKVIRERRQIQLTGTFTSDNAVLMYVSSGQSADNASQVDWQAFRCLQTYADWQRSPNASNIYSPEARTFYNEKRLFRANKDDLTVVDLKQIIRKEYHASIKN